MNEALLFTVLFTVVAMIIIHIAIVASFQDLKLTRFMQTLIGQPKKRFKPSTAIIVTTQNEAVATLSTLKNLNRLKLTSLEVIVIDNASTDETKKEIKKFQKQHIYFKLTVIFKRKPSSGHHSLLKQAAKKISKAKFFLVIPSGSILTKQTLQTMQSCVQASQEPSIRFPTLSYIRPSYGSVFTGYIELTKYLFVKAFHKFLAYRHLERERVVAGKVEELKSSAQRARFTYLSYATAVRMEEAKSLPTYKWRLLYLTWIIVAAYFLYIHLILQDSRLLLYSIGLLIVWLVLILASTPHLTRKERLAVAATIPFSYVFIFAMTVLQLLYPKKWV